MPEFWLVFHRNNHRRLLFKGTLNECLDFKNKSEDYCMEQF